MRHAAFLTASVLTMVVTAANAQLPPAPSGISGDNSPKPRVHVAKKLLDLGKVIEGEKVPVSWTIENQGSANLVIDKTTSTCGCTVVHLEEQQKTIPPGGSLDLKAEFNTKGRRGNQNKFVGVFTNDPAEPELKLEFHANVEALFNVDPPGIYNIRALQRGQTPDKPIELIPASGYRTLVVGEVQLEDGANLSAEVEPLPLPSGTGQRVRLRVSDVAPLGTLTTSATIRLKVDDVEREVVVPIRAEVVGDLTWTPLVLDATRQILLAGRTLAPVTVRSTDKAVFEIVEAAAGPMLDVTYEQVSGPPGRCAYSVYVKVRDGVPPGPFATSLDIQTDSLDQPLIQIPVFGVIMPPLQADPPLVLLRPDGTPAGTERRLRLIAEPNVRLEVSQVTCDHPEIVAGVETQKGPKPQHLQFVKVKLTGDAAAGPGKTMLHITTNVPGYEKFDVPLILAPRKQ